MAFLRVLNGLNPGQVFSLDGASVVLGRHPECDIVLEVGAISRQHARIVELDGKYYLEDLRSRNGTYLNNEQVTARQELSENDEIRICDLTFAFQSDRPSSSDGLEATADHDDATIMMVDGGEPLSNSTIMSKVDVSTGSTGLRLSVNPELKLKALVEIGQNLGKAVALKEVLPKLLDSLFSVFAQADRGFIVLKHPESGALVPQAVKCRDEDGQTIRLSRTIANDVMKSKEAVLSADAASDSRFDMAESIVDFQIRSMMCAPLVGSDGSALGVIQVDSLDQRKSFNRDDLEVLASVASQVAISVENAQLHETALRERALERELAVAHEVQQGFLPAAPPRVEGYGFFDFYEAANQLGGDYFDYVRLPEGRLAIMLADVAGKGISAALLVAKLSSETRFSLIAEPTPEAAISRLNNVFCESRWEDRFVTSVLAILEPQRHKLTVVNAGHMAPLLRHAAGELEEVGNAEVGVPLGVSQDFPYDPCTIDLAPGDTLTLYTDGITEAMNGQGELYGFARLRNVISRPAEGVADLGQNLLSDVQRFVGSRSQSDDMCICCFGRLE
jgi:serine phosphatase RsbU (regulator of sigma subunit)/pSer/pThr/pTyr-binding forkhead associated (FHA) protein